MRTTGVWCAGLLAAGLLSACDSGGDAAEVDDDAAWRTSTAAVETAGLTWAVGSTVHLPDGTPIDRGEPVRAYVVAGDGVFFVPSSEVAEDTPFVDAPLWFAAPDEEAEDTGLAVTERGGLA